jgi:hypothetical protein
MSAAAPDAALPVTAELLAAIREQHRAVEVAGARLEAARPQVRVEARAPLDGTIGDAPLRLQPGERMQTRVDHALAIELPGVASILVDPGAATDQQGAALSAAESRLAALLASAGATDLTEAERVHARRETATRAIEEQRRIRASVLQGAAPRAMGERIIALRERLGSDQPAVDPDDLGQAVEPETAQAELAAAEQALRVAEEARETARTELMTVEVAVGRRETEARLASEDVARRQVALEAARAVSPDDELGRRLATTDATEQRTEAELVSSRDELVRQGPETAREQLAESKRALESLDVETRLVQDRLLEVTTRLRAHGEDGLAEDLTEQQARRDHAEAELGRYRGRAAARRLLFETLRDERDRSRRSYVDPLRREIERLGRLVFGGGFAVELDESSLEVVSRTLDGRTIPYASLSVGAQEQIAIIGRLACATIVAPDGGVPVILDDALGNSDPVRLRAMGDVLAAAGRECQIIVLTCQPDRYDHLAAAQVVRLE